MAVSFSNFTTLANTALDHYIRTDPVAQNIQKKPLLEKLISGKKSFPGGKGYVDGPVQGQWMRQQSGFFGWYSHTDQVTFVHPDNILRAKYLWREWHGGMVLDFTELKNHGVTIDFTGNAVPRDARQIQIVKNWLESVMGADFGESLAWSLDDALWNDGTQSSKAVVGITGILDDDPTSGTIGGLNRATYDWWRHRINLTVPYDPANLDLLNFLDEEFLQLGRYGGMPDCAFAGSDWLAALRKEIRKSGYIQTQNWNNRQATQIRMTDVAYGDIVFQYAPWLDDNGMAKRCYIMDSRHVKLMPVMDDWMKSHKATRPYDQFVLFKSVTGSGALSFDQLNCHGVYSIA